MPDKPDLAARVYDALLHHGPKAAAKHVKAASANDVRRKSEWAEKTFTRDDGGNWHPTRDGQKRTRKS